MSILSQSSALSMTRSTSNADRTAYSTRSVITTATSESQSQSIKTLSSSWYSTKNDVKECEQCKEEAYLVVTEGSFIQLCADYGLAPQVVSVHRCRAIFARAAAGTHKDKLVYKHTHTQWLASQSQTQSLTHTRVDACQGRPSQGDRRVDDKGDGDGGKRTPAAAGTNISTTNKNNINNRSDNQRNSISCNTSNNQSSINSSNYKIEKIAVSALGFSELLEAVARVAVEGMRQHRHLRALYPTASDRVQAVLTDWGLADLSRLEEVKVLRQG